MKKTKAKVTCYCGRGPYIVTIDQTVKCPCGITLHIESHAGGWNGRVWGTASRKRMKDAAKDVQEGRSKLDAQWLE